MQSVTITHIIESLKKLPPEKLTVVFDFISYLLDREKKTSLLREPSETYQTMLASEDILRIDWDSPEEDAVWKNL